MIHCNIRIVFTLLFIILCALSHPLLFIFSLNSFKSQPFCFAYHKYNLKFAIAFVIHFEIHLLSNIFLKYTIQKRMQYSLREHKIEFYNP